MSNNKPLHDAARRKLVGALRGLLAAAIYDGVVFMFKNRLGDVLQSANIRWKYSKDFELEMMMQWELERINGAKFPRVSESTQLSDVISSGEIELLADRVVDWIQTFPRRYVFYIPLIQLDPFGAGRINLADGLSLVDPVDGAKYDTLLTFSDEVEKQGAKMEGQELRIGTRYIRVESDGFYFSHSRDSAAVSALSKAKQWIVLAEAFGWIAYEYGALNAPRVAPAVCISDKQYRISLDLAVQHAETLARVAWAARTLSPTRSALVQMRTGEDVKKPEGAELATLVMARVGMFSKILDSDKASGAKELKAACEWFFDARVEINETVKFIYVSVAFEALLGSGSPDGVTRQMTDRVAFLLGSGKQDRAEISEKFEKFYKTRSSIVHGREARILPEEEELCAWAEAQLLRAIKLEANSMLVDNF